MAKDKKEYKNLFDAVSEIEGKKTTEDFGLKNNQDDLSQTFRRVEKMHEEISRGLEHAFRFNDLTPSQFRAYLSRPQNFSKQEWELIQREKKLNNERLKALLEKIHSASQSVGNENTSHFEAKDAFEEGEELSDKPLEPSKELVNVSKDGGPQEDKKEVSSEAQSSKEPKKRPRLSKRNWINMH